MYVLVEEGVQHVLQNETFGTFDNLVGNIRSGWWLYFQVTKYCCLIVLLVPELVRP